MNDWRGVFSEFNDKIADFIGKDNQAKLVQKFTTTNPDNFAVQNITLMCAMKKYFEYMVMTLCGIPEIKLLGTVEDWQLLDEKVSELAEWDAKNKIGLEGWLKDLQGISKQFLSAAQGKPEIKFW